SFLMQSAFIRRIDILNHGQALVWDRSLRSREHTMESAYSGRVVLITGAAAGIGKATAQAFAAQGARLILADIDTINGEETVAGIREQGGDVMFCQCDVADAAQVRWMRGRFGREDGRLACAASSAGLAWGQDKLGDGDGRVCARIMDIAVKGVWEC